MGNYNKYMYLLIGVIIGAAVAIIGVTQLKPGDDTDINNKNEILEGKNDGHEGEDEHGGENVKLSESELKEFGIQLGQVESMKLQMHSDLTGEIIPDPDKLAHIVPRFAGVVKTVNKEIGDKVTKDEIIAVIESNESLVTYEVKSSIEGIVLDLHMTPGELIGDDKHIVTIADLNVVWAELNVYQKDLTKIRIGQNTQVYFNEIDNSVNGKIFYLSPTVDEHTRTATARIRLNNSNGLWKPGMFITAKVLTDFAQVEKAVTINAIQNFEGQKVVFVKNGDGFQPRAVTVGKTNTKYAEIISGLNEGQSYIAEGAFVIKSELLKESFGGGHGH